MPCAHPNQVASSLCSAVVKSVVYSVLGCSREEVCMGVWAFILFADYVMGMHRQWLMNTGVGFPTTIMQAEWYQQRM
jgi:hypothetical protein